jgi:hypothetical protein
MHASSRRRYGKGGGLCEGRRRRLWSESLVIEPPRRMPRACGRNFVSNCFCCVSVRDSAGRHPSKKWPRASQLGVVLRDRNLAFAWSGIDYVHETQKRICIVGDNVP